MASSQGQLIEFTEQFIMFCNVSLIEAGQIGEKTHFVLSYVSYFCFHNMSFLGLHFLSNVTCSSKYIFKMFPVAQSNIHTGLRID